MQVKDPWKGCRGSSQAFRPVQEDHRKERHAYNHLEVQDDLHVVGASAPTTGLGFPISVQSTP